MQQEHRRRLRMRDSRLPHDARSAVPGRAVSRRTVLRRGVLRCGIPQHLPPVDPAGMHELVDGTAPRPAPVKPIGDLAAMRRG